MGILLVGIVAALFFRNEPLKMSDVPSVRRERELNQQLKDRNVAVYLDEEPHIDGQTRDDSNGPWTLKQLFDQLNSRNDGVPVPVGSAASEKKTTVNVLPPEAPRSQFRPVDDGPSTDQVPRPLPPLPSLPKEPADFAAADTSREQKDGVKLKAADNPSKDDDSPAGEFQLPEEFREYTVEYGDTLSEIAERFLGSQARYREIYEANKDRMDSPDHLRVGKAIRIPLH
ncbi:MAG: LysM peptidoglycan-binding domain-containing protein [Planctomycetaceae bacterium]|nr:LysM peptidoglycan-binding domain-containing protein [Planctomycetaceae bacterium]